MGDVESVRTQAGLEWLPFARPIMFRRPSYLQPSAWLEHLPFAMWIIDAHRPATVVELGTHNGPSYFGFCQAVAELGLDTACYAVDTWQGDEHAGYYGKEVYERVRVHNDTHYSGFSRLVRSTFDDAAAHFSDGSIDLLHIDGLHTLEAVSHDFETWKPKLSSRAVVLFHDINVRERGFGVFKLFEQLREQYPAFWFVHGHGLGVLGVGAEQGEAMEGLYALTGKQASALMPVREIFARLGRACADAFEGGALRVPESVAVVAMHKQRVLDIATIAAAERGRLLEQLERLRGAFAEAERNVSGLSDRMAREQHEHRLVLEGQRRAHQDEVEAAARKQGEHRLALEEQRGAHLREMEKATLEREELAGIAQAREAELKDAERIWQQRLDQLAADHHDELELAEKDARERLDRAKAGHQTELSNVEQDWRERLDRARAEHQTELSNVEQDWRERLDRARAEHQTELAKLEQDWRERLNRAIAAHQDEQQRGAADWEQKIAGADEEHRKQIRERFEETAALTRRVIETEQQLFRGTSDWNRREAHLQRLEGDVGLRLLNRLRRLFFRSPLVVRVDPRQEDIDLIRASGSLDATWYLEAYPDVAADGVDAVEHYVRFGAGEGRDPSPRFSTLDYVGRYADVYESGINPLAHFVMHGRSEGRSAEPAQGDD